MIRFLQTPGRTKKIVLGGLLLIICAAMVITLVPGLASLRDRQYRRSRYALRGGEGLKLAIAQVRQARQANVDELLAAFYDCLPEMSAQGRKQLGAMCLRCQRIHLAVRVYHDPVDVAGGF